MVKIIKYMHSNKICHRDLKPENFLMFDQETLDLKLTDFGLSTKWATDLRK
jgi:serine/threonine protein kinase